MFSTRSSWRLHAKWFELRIPVGVCVRFDAVLRRRTRSAVDQVAKVGKTLTMIEMDFWATATTLDVGADLVMMRNLGMIMLSTNRMVSMDASFEFRRGTFCVVVFKAEAVGACTG